MSQSAKSVGNRAKRTLARVGMLLECMQVWRPEREMVLLSNVRRRQVTSTESTCLGNVTREGKKDRYCLFRSKLLHANRRVKLCWMVAQKPVLDDYPCAREESGPDTCLCNRILVLSVRAGA